MQLLDEFGNLIGEKKSENKVIKLYRLYDFYVEVFYNNLNRRVEHVEPVKNSNLLLLFSA